jgi:hypothetical protein
MCTIYMLTVFFNTGTEIKHMFYNTSSMEIFLLLTYKQTFRMVINIYLQYNSKVANEFYHHISAGTASGLER